MLQAEKPLPCCKAAYRQSRGYFLLCLLGLLVLNSSRTRSGVGFRPRSIILLQNGKIRTFAVSKKYVSSLTLALTHPPPSSLPVSLYPTYLWLASSHYGNACFNVNPSTRLTRCTFFSFSFFLTGAHVTFFKLNSPTYPTYVFFEKWQTDMHRILYTCIGKQSAILWWWQHHKLYLFCRIFCSKKISNCTRTAHSTQTSTYPNKDIGVSLQRANFPDCNFKIDKVVTRKNAEFHFKVSSVKNTNWNGKNLYLSTDDCLSNMESLPFLQPPAPSLPSLILLLLYSLDAWRACLWAVMARAL